MSIRSQSYRHGLIVNSPFYKRLACRTGNGVGHIDEVKLRRALLVMGLVSTFSGYTIPECVLAVAP